MGPLSGIEPLSRHGAVESAWGMEALRGGVIRRRRYHHPLFFKEAVRERPRGGRKRRVYKGEISFRLSRYEVAGSACSHGRLVR